MRHDPKAWVKLNMPMTGDDRLVMIKLEDGRIMAGNMQVIEGEQIRVSELIERFKR